MIKTILEQAITLPKKDFLDKILSLNQVEIIDTWENEPSLKNQYQEKVNAIYKEDIVEKDLYKEFGFAQSISLLSLLTPDIRGKILYCSCIHGQHFKVAYNVVELGYAPNSNMNKFFPHFAFDELSRLSHTDTFPHLENTIDHLHFLEQVFKPFLEPATYHFILYASFVHHVKNGFNFNNKNFLNLLGLQDDNTYAVFKKEFYTNSMNLIEQYKQKLGFDLWTPDLLSLFHKDIKTPNPYSRIGISNQKYELEQFAPYSHALEKIMMKDGLDHKLPAKGIANKKAKL